MKYLLFASAAGFLVYLLIARWQALWPFNGGSFATGSREKAIIDTLVHRTPATDRLPTIYSQSPLSAEVLQGVADAFIEREATARARGWRNGFTPSDYTMYVFPSVRDHDADGNYSPVFQVFFEAGSWYDGSIYDKEPNSPGGWTYAAERVFTNVEALTDTFVIAQNDRRDYTQRAVSYALDHLLAYKNDPDLYERTKDHSSGGGHPLW